MFSVSIVGYEVPTASAVLEIGRRLHAASPVEVFTPSAGRSLASIVLVVGGVVLGVIVVAVAILLLVVWRTRPRPPAVGPWPTPPTSPAP